MTRKITRRTTIRRRIWKHKRSVIIFKIVMMISERRRMRVSVLCPAGVPGPAGGRETIESQSPADCRTGMSTAQHWEWESTSRQWGEDESQQLSLVVTAGGAGKQHYQAQNINSIRYLSSLDLVPLKTKVFVLQNIICKIPRASVYNKHNYLDKEGLPILFF